MGSGQSHLLTQLVFATVQAGGLVRGHSGLSLIDSPPQLVFATVHSFQAGGNAGLEGSADIETLENKKTRKWRKTGNFWASYQHGNKC